MVIYQAPAIKKALLVGAGIGGTYTLITGFSDRQEAEVPRDDLKLSVDDTGGLGAATTSVLDTARSIAAAASSARKAWSKRYEGDRSPGQEIQSAPSMAAAAAFLANLGSTDQAAEAPKGPRTLAKHLAGSHLVSKLLAAAATAPASTLEFQETCRYASAMLGAPDTATALLSPPGNCTNVLSLASASPELRAAALTALASPQLTLGDAAPPDVDHALHAATTRRQPDDQRLLALRLLRCWAQDSVRNCQALSASGAGEALHTAANTVGPEERDARAEIAALMQTLAADAPAGTLRMLRMEGWLWPALCFAADAAGAEDWALAEASMAAFSAAVRRGCKVPAALVQGSVLPLLRQLASISSAQPQKSKAKGGVAHPQVDERTAQELRVSIANCVQALAEGQGAAGTLQSDDRMAWADIFLSWLTESSSEVDAKAQRAQQGRVVSDAAVGALSAMASPPGAEGLQVAHAWLAEMIVHLSRQVQLKKLTPSAPASEAMQEDSGSAWYWTEYFKPSYWRYGSKGTGQSQEGVLAATGAVGEAGGPASGPTAAESAIVQTEADLELATEAEKALAGVLQSSVEAASLTGKSSWSAWVPGLPSFWKSRGSEGGDQGRAEGVARSPSDSELAQYITAAPVGPLYARAVAAELIEASGRVGNLPEVPSTAEEILPPTAMASYPTIAAAVDIEVADKALCQALKVMCALTAGDKRHRDWVVASGAMPMLRRLALEHGRDVAQVMADARRAENAQKQERMEGASEADVEVDDALPLSVLRQVTRLLALLSADISGAGALAEGGWVPWLQRHAAATDCKISSCAARALLHVESAAAMFRGGAEVPLTPGEERWRGTLSRTAAGDHLLPPRAPMTVPTGECVPCDTSGGNVGSTSTSSANNGVDGVHLTQAVAHVSDLPPALDAAFARVKKGLDQFSMEVVGRRAAVPPSQRLVLHDGVHLFDPLAPHNEALARHGIDDSSPDAPLIDIVFVHGIRGGAFATWRRDGVLARGAARENLDRSVCWPTAWLAPKFPQARLISAEYYAPASGWEGESLPLNYTAQQVAEKLAAAGVGRRPVIFVGHSMGGLVVKEIMARGYRADAPAAVRALSQACAGVVFYAVPHAGSRLADLGWGLRYIGASPAKAVAHLKTGPHQDEANAAMRKMARKAGLPVLSFSEGLPTQMSYVSAHIVPHESAYPGFGEFVVLKEHDHVSVCKPKDQDDPAFAVFAEFLNECYAAAARAAAEKREAVVDHMEAAL